MGIGNLQKRIEEWRRGLQELLDGDAAGCSEQEGSGSENGSQRVFPAFHGPKPEFMIAFSFRECRNRDSETFQMTIHANKSFCDAVEAIIGEVNRVHSGNCWSGVGVWTGLCLSGNPDRTLIEQLLILVTGE